MLVLGYYLFIFISGLSLASLMGGLSLLARCALAPAMGIFLGSLFVYLLNMLHLPITGPTLMALWFPTGISLALIRLREIKLLAVKLLDFFRQESRSIKVLSIVVLLGFIGMSARGSLNPMWDGDAYLHWGPKAIEWIKNAHIHYNPQLEQRLRLWVNYPLYHSIGMMMNVLLLPLPPAYSIKVFDVLHLWGLFLSIAFFMQGLGWSRRHILLGSLLALFVQKDLLGFVMSGYAEIEMAYYYFLGAALLISMTKTSPTTFFCAGFTLGLMSITKNEGGIRLVILILCCLTGPWRKNLSWKKVALFILPIILLKGIDRLNSPVNYFTDWYYENAHLSLPYLLSRLPFILKTALVAFQPQGPLKSFWPLSITLAVIFAVVSHKRQWPYRHLSNLLLLLFIGNCLFDHIPSWLADKSQDPAALAREVIGRLHNQSSTFLALLVVMGLRQFTFQFSLLSHKDGG